MRNSAAIEQRNWIGRRLSNSAPFVIAAIVHVAVFAALAYEMAGGIVMTEPPATIAVEIVFAVPGNGSPSFAEADHVDHQAPADGAEQILPDATAEQSQQPDAPRDASAVPAPVIAPKPAPRRSATTAKPATHQASAVKRVAPPMALAPTLEQPGASHAFGIDATATMEASPAPSNVTSTWKVRLMSHLDRHKRYPEAARARRAEGTAYLKLGMDRDGRVLEYHLVHSSGHIELDNEVIAMIKRASPLPPAPPEIRAQVVQLVVPVRFRM